MLVGHGYDIHRLQPGGRLVLAAVTVADDLSPIAHSDGDVVIHALVDAILGALARGDIGQMFPDTDPRWRAADSRVFLRAVMDELRASAYHVVNADITILAERPRLQPFKAQMAQFLSSALAAPVNIKAATNEGCDSIGQGQAIAAHAVVLLAPD